MSARKRRRNRSGGAERPEVEARHKGPTTFIVVATALAAAAVSAVFFSRVLRSDGYLASLLRQMALVGTRSWSEVNQRVIESFANNADGRQWLAVHQALELVKQAGAEGSARKTAAERLDALTAANSENELLRAASSFTAIRAEPAADPHAAFENWRRRVTVDPGPAPFRLFQGPAARFAEPMLARYGLRSDFAARLAARECTIEPQFAALPQLAADAASLVDRLERTGLSEQARQVRVYGFELFRGLLENESPLVTGLLCADLLCVMAPRSGIEGSLRAWRDDLRRRVHAAAEAALPDWADVTFSPTLAPKAFRALAGHLVEALSALGMMLGACLMFLAGLFAAMIRQTPAASKVLNTPSEPGFRRLGIATRIIALVLFCGWIVLTVAVRAVVHEAGWGLWPLAVTLALVVSAAGLSAGAARPFEPGRVAGWLGWIGPMIVGVGVPWFSPVVIARIHRTIGPLGWLAGLAILGVVFILARRAIRAASSPPARADSPAVRRRRLAWSATAWLAFALVGLVQVLLSESADRAYAQAVRAATTSEIAARIGADQWRTDRNELDRILAGYLRAGPSSAPGASSSAGS